MKEKQDIKVKYWIQLGGNRIEKTVTIIGNAFSENMGCSAEDAALGIADLFESDYIQKGREIVSISPKYERG